MTLKQVIECDGCPTIIEFEGDVELGPLMKKLEWTMSDSGKTHLCSSCYILKNRPSGDYGYVLGYISGIPPKWGRTSKVWRTKKQVQIHIKKHIDNLRGKNARAVKATKNEFLHHFQKEFDDERPSRGRCCRNGCMRCEQ